MWAVVSDHAPWQQLLSSPLQRCRAFAERLAERHQLSLTIEPRFREVGFGDWEGLDHELVKHSRPAEYSAFYRDPVGHRPAGAEPLEVFMARVTAGYQDCIRACAGGHILIVSHAGVIRAVVGHILQTPPASLYRIRIDHAAITRIRHSNHGATLELLNSRSA